MRDNISNQQTFVPRYILFIFAISAAAVAAQLSAQSTTASGVAKPSSTPIMAAKPEHVTLTDGAGSTEIQWDTGNTSVGFVYVTGPGRQSDLFGTGANGSLKAPWIGTGNYVFELYGDPERRNLLASVTVSGAAEALAAENVSLWRSVARWLLIVGLMTVVYFAVYSSSAATLRTTFPTEPATSPRRLHVGRNLFLGIAAFVCLDGIIFHTKLYPSMLSPDSYAGRLAVITRAENERAPSSLKEVLVLGDSRMAEGFSTVVADKLGSSAGLKFVNLTEPASSVSAWYYMLREVDPATTRYSAIVVPYGVGYEPSTADPLRISMAAPLLHYGDCFNFASAFERWSGRFRAFTACILRGSAYQSDVADFCEHPLARIKSVEEEPAKLRSRNLYTGRDYDLVGTSYDPKTGEVSFAPKLTEAQRQAIRKSLVHPSQAEIEYYLKLQHDWIPRIVKRYANSPTAIVLTPVPRGPFVALSGLSMGHDPAVPHLASQSNSLSLPEQTFDFLEKPEYYFDAYHLNAKGRQRFTETLVAELLGHLGSAASHRDVYAEWQVAANRSTGSNKAD